MFRRREAPRFGAALVMSVALAAGTVSVAPREGRAQAGPRAGAAANAGIDQAIAAFEAHDYERALRLFQDAYVARHDPALLFNVAATLERLNRLNEAVDALQTYLSRADNAEGRHIAQERLDALRARIASSAPPPTEAVSSPPPASIAPPPERHRPAGSIVPGVIVGGIGVAAVAAGAIVFALAPDPGLERSVQSEQAYRDASHASDTQRVVGAIVGGVGVAAIVAGVVLIVTSRGHSSVDRARIFIAPDAAGASIGVVHEF
jgi:hypothetical protein